MTLLSFGTHLTHALDPMQRVAANRIHAVLTADAGLADTTGRLRRLAQLDKTAYQAVKVRLPYVVGGVFADGLRRLEHLEAAHYFILDLDDCPGLEGRVPDAVRRDETVELAFISPGGRGMKLFFRLTEPCPCPVRFSAAYKAFAGWFGAEHRWVSHVDMRCADATRACFLAHDAAAHHNPLSLTVDWRHWLAEAAPPPTLFEPAEEQPAAPQPAARPLNEAALQQLRQQINPQAAARRPKQVFVPEPVQALEPDVRRLCHEQGWTLKEMRPLNYGLCFVLAQGLRTAEINVFHGARGYTLVRSVKTGTDPHLTEKAHALLFGWLFGAPECPVPPPVPPIRLLPDHTLPY